MTTVAPFGKEATGILLVEFNSTTSGMSFDFLFHFFSNPEVSSRCARDLLSSASPDKRVAGKADNRKMILVPNYLINKAPSTEEIRGFAKKHSWLTPTIEEALRLFCVLSDNNFRNSLCEKIVVMHNPVKGCVLGVNVSNGKMMVNKEGADPKKIWESLSTWSVFRAE